MAQPEIAAPSEINLLANRPYLPRAPIKLRGVAFGGFVSEPPEAMSIGMYGGVWALSQNGRSNGSSWASRLGGTILNTGLPSGCLAAIQFYACSLNGVLHVVGAFFDSTANVRLYDCTSLSTWGWNEITETAGYDGNTRFAPSLTITGATNATPIIVTTSAAHGLVDGQPVYQAGVTGNTNANGAFFVKVTGAGGVTKYALYSDIGLTIPIAGNGAYGGTPFASTVTRMAFASWRTPVILYDVNTLSDRDVLQISDGITGRVYDPANSFGAGVVGGKLWNHANIITPQNASLTQVATFSNFSQIAGTARTYQTAHTSVQSVRFFCADTSVAPYTTTNACVLLTEASAAVGDSAGFPLASAMTFTGMMGMFVECSAGTLDDVVKHVQILVSPNKLNQIAIASSTNATPIVVTAAVSHLLVDGDQVTIVDHLVNTSANGAFYARVTGAGGVTKFALYDTAAHAIAGGPTGAIAGVGVGGATGTVNINFTVAYDPSSTAANADSFNTPEFSRALDSGTTPRWELYFDLNHLNTLNNQVSIGYIKLQRVTAASAAGPLTMSILAVVSGGTLRGGSQFAAALEHPFAFSEGAGFVTTGVTTATISQFGGPTLVTASPANIPAPVLPPPAFVVRYDFRLTTQVPSNLVGTGTLAGGSIGAGTPTAVAFYLKAAGDPTGDYTYLITKDIVSATGAAGVWAYDFSTPTATYLTSTSPFSLINENYRTSSRLLPITAQISIPPALAYASVFGRILALGPAITNSSKTGAVHYSSFQFPNRFMPEPEDFFGNPLDTAGGRALFPGEKVMTFAGNAVGDGQSNLYVLTDRAIWRFGDQANQGTTFPAPRLSTPTFIAEHGTQSPFGVVVHHGTIIYPDQNNDIMQFSGGTADNISYRKVGDKITNLPAGRIGQLVSSALGNRVYMAYTPAGGTLNTRILVRNLIRGFWESDDLLPNDWDVASAQWIFDPTAPGAGQRLLIMSKSGNMAAYDENATTDFGNATMPCVLTTGWYWDGDQKMYLARVHLWGQAQSGQVMTIDRFYVETGAQFRSTLSLTDRDDGTLLYIGNEDSLAVTEVTATNQPQGGYRMYMSFSWNYGPGKRLDRLSVALVGQGASKGKAST